MKKFYPLFFFLSIAVFAQAQTKFTRFFFNSPETINLTSICQTSGGGYIATGSVSTSSGQKDKFLCKFNSAGDTVWTQRIAGTGSITAQDVKQTSDGGYIIAAQTDAPGAGPPAPPPAPPDATGIFQWSKLYGGPNADYLYSINQNSDDGFIIGGQYKDTAYKALLIRTNSLGDTLWTQSWSSGNDNRIDVHYAVQSSDGGFLATGGNANIQNVSLVKLNSTGMPLWVGDTYSYGWTPLTGYYAAETLDGNYISLQNSSYGGIPILNKFDINGNRLYLKNIGNSHGLSPTLRELPDSSLLMIYDKRYQSPNYSINLLKLTSNGDTVWQRSVSPDLQYHYSFSPTSDGGFIGIDENGNLNPGIIKMDSLLNTECASSVASPCPTISTNSIQQPVLNYSSVALSINSATLSNLPYTSSRLYTPCTPNIPICMVTVDSLAQKNLVVWEENFDTTFIDSYQVYKESFVAGQYN